MGLQYPTPAHLKRPSSSAPNPEHSWTRGGEFCSNDYRVIWQNLAARVVILIQRAEGQELMGDYFGSIALSDFLSKHPIKTPLDLIGSNFLFFIINCIDKKSANPPTVDEHFLKNRNIHGKKFMYGHPPDFQRVVQVTMANPQLNKMYNCMPPNQTSKCFSLYEHERTVKSPKSPKRRPSKK